MTKDAKKKTLKSALKQYEGSKEDNAADKAAVVSKYKNLKK